MKIRKKIYKLKNFNIDNQSKNIELKNHNQKEQKGLEQNSRKSSISNNKKNLEKKERERENEKLKENDLRNKNKFNYNDNENDNHNDNEKINESERKKLMNTGDLSSQIENKSDIFVNKLEEFNKNHKENNNNNLNVKNINEKNNNNKFIDECKDSKEKEKEKLKKIDEYFNEEDSLSSVKTNKTSIKNKNENEINYENNNDDGENIIMDFTENLESEIDLRIRKVKFMEDIENMNYFNQKIIESNIKNNLKTSEISDNIDIKRDNENNNNNQVNIKNFMENIQKSITGSSKNKSSSSKENERDSNREYNLTGEIYLKRRRGSNLRKKNNENLKELNSIPNSKSIELDLNLIDNDIAEIRDSIRIKINPINGEGENILKKKYEKEKEMEMEIKMEKEIEFKKK